MIVRFSYAISISLFRTVPPAFAQSDNLRDTGSGDRVPDGGVR